MRFFSRLFQASAQKQRYGGDLDVRESFRALRYLPPFLRMVWHTHRGMALATIGLRLLQAGLPVTFLFVGKLIIDEVVRLMEAGNGLSPYLWYWLGAELGLALLGAGLSRAISLVEALLGDLLSNYTSVRLIEQAARLDLPKFEDAAFYDKLERARRQTVTRSLLLSDLMEQAERLISILLLGAGLVAFSPWLILLLVLAVLPAFLSETHFNQRSYSLARNWTPERRELDYLRYIGTSDETAKEVKIFGLEGHLRDRYAEMAARYYEANRHLAVRRAGWGFGLSGLGDLGYYAAYAILIIRTVSGDISLGDLTFLAGSFRQLRSNLRSLLSRFSFIAQSALYLRDLFDFLHMAPSIQAPEAPQAFPQPIARGFAFEGVSFRYPSSGKYAVRDLSFELKAGEKLALVGENGAGKTTLVKLISRLYDPTDGRILLDGRDLREYDPADLRRAIGVIFQDFVRFQFSASDNIAVGRIEDRLEQG
ncbi:MAG: ABC transporter ATP-binding protein, partial [Bacteroidetes bacterium]